MMRFELYENPRGHIACQGRVSYRGPVSPRDLPRIKLDLIADERLVLATKQSRVFHPYGDEPKNGLFARSYAYEEVFGEKVRALGERTRPRDLYDVINLFRNERARPAAAVLRDVLRQKCDFKGLQPPNLEDIEQHWDDLQASWKSMLSHQLPFLPPVESYWSELPAFFQWLYEGIAPAGPNPYGGEAKETVIRSRDLRSVGLGPALLRIEVIRFAAANHLCVDLRYLGSTRRIEPYSLRRTRAGMLMLHAHNVARNQHRSYRVDRIQDAQVTNQTFVPRHQIELSPTEPLPIRPTRRRGR